MAFEVKEVKVLPKRELGEFDEEYILKSAKENYEGGIADIRIDPRKTALIVVDLTKEFVKPNWSPYWIPEATRQLPEVKSLIDACREAGMTIIFTYASYHSKGLDRNPCARLVPTGKAANEFAKQLFIRETIDPTIRPKYGEEVVIPKWSYSAFFHTPLDYVLRNVEADTVIICGTMTNYCCGTTAREAMIRGYKVVFGSDVNATDDAEIQKAELKTLRRGFALVITCNEIIEAIKGKGPYAAKPL